MIFHLFIYRLNTGQTWWVQFYDHIDVDDGIDRVQEWDEIRNRVFGKYAPRELNHLTTRIY